MFGVDTDCPYLCVDCYELGCAYCNIEEQLSEYDEGCDED